MDIQHQGMAILLRNALNNENIPLPEGFDWECAARLARVHRLTGLALQGAARCGVPRSHPVIARMTLEFCQQVQYGRGQEKRLQQVLERFAAEGIDHMPVKGAVIKAMYPKPECRTMGDADVLIRQEQYDRIRQTLLDMGMEELEVTSDYEAAWGDASLKLELHTKLVTKQYKRFYRYYGTGWRLAKKQADSCCYLLSAEDHLVYLVGHFAKHYLEGSICAKDLCDFWVWRKTYPQMDDAYLRRELKKLKLDSFYENICALLACWFEGSEPTEAVELITHAAFAGGVYGELDDSAVHGAMHRHSGDESLGKQKRQWFLRAIFPSSATLEYKYPVLKKWPILLPIFWVYRWYLALFREHDRLKRGMLVAKMDENQQNQYRSHMDTVGLEPDD